MTACHELQEHHCLQLGMIEAMNGIAEIKQTKALNHAE